MNIEMKLVCVELITLDYIEEIVQNITKEHNINIDIVIEDFTDNTSFRNQFKLLTKDTDVLGFLISPSTEKLLEMTGVDIEKYNNMFVIDNQKDIEASLLYMFKVISEDEYKELRGIEDEPVLDSIWEEESEDLSLDLDSISDVVDSLEETNSYESQEDYQKNNNGNLSNKKLEELKKLQETLFLERNELREKEKELNEKSENLEKQLESITYYEENQKVIENVTNQLKEVESENRVLINKIKQNKDELEDTKRDLLELNSKYKTIKEELESQISLEEDTASVSILVRKFNNINVLISATNASQLVVYQYLSTRKGKNLIIDLSEESYLDGAVQIQPPIFNLNKYFIEDKHELKNLISTGKTIDNREVGVASYLAGLYDIKELRKNIKYYNFFSDLENLTEIYDEVYVYMGVHDEYNYKVYKQLQNAVKTRYFIGSSPFEKRILATRFIPSIHKLNTTTDKEDLIDVIVPKNLQDLPKELTIVETY